MQQSPGKPNPIEDATNTLSDSPHMRITYRLPILSLTLALSGPAVLITQNPGPPQTEAEKTALLDRIVVNQKKCDQALDVYERIERVETRKTADSRTFDVKITRVIPSGTGMYKIALGADAKPSDAAAYRTALERLEKSLTLVVANDRSQRDGIEKYAKRRKDRSDLIDATRTAFLYTYVSSEPRGNRTLLKYRMEPNPSFKPTSRTTAIFAKVRGFVWIDEATNQLARVEGEVTDDISIGLFLAKVYKGSHFMQEHYEISPGVWLPTFSQYDFDGRKFFSGFSIHERTFYSNYRFVGTPKETLAAIRSELGRSDLSKAGASRADP